MPLFNLVAAGLAMMGQLVSLCPPCCPWYGEPGLVCPSPPLTHRGHQAIAVPAGVGSERSTVPNGLVTGLGGLDADTVIADLMFKGPAFPGGENVTLSGSAEDIYKQLLEINPNYAADNHVDDVDADEKRGLEARQGPVGFGQSSFQAIQTF